ncbi:hypothetical protein ACSV5M_06485 [Cellvibrio sp. ARAG 10.3]|uniref:hypothetical protein n=1 Tax=Cellvibrio sp. ARAG 10.3 TaxID=3451358 RepID=UPI003F4895AD
MLLTPLEQSLCQRQRMLFSMQFRRVWAVLSVAVGIARLVAASESGKVLPVSGKAASHGDLLEGVASHSLTWVKSVQCAP